MIDRDRIISWLTIGGSTTDPATRCVGWGLQASGWRGFVDNVIATHRKWGCKRFCLHNAFGVLPGEAMQFDQYLAAKEAKLRWLTDDFEKAWKPVTAAGVEVIAYFGALQDELDPDFARYDTAQEFDQWLVRVADSLRPALNAGMSIGFDTAGGVPADARVIPLMEIAAATGVKVYSEPRPRLHNPRLFGYPTITQDTFWHRSDPAVYEDAAMLYATNEQITGEKIVITTGEAGKPPQWLADKVAGIQAAGWTAATQVTHLMRAVN